MTLLSENPTTVSNDPADVASRWLGELERAYTAGDRAALSALFAADATWRDKVSFSWTITNWEGAESVADALLGYADRKAHDFRLRPGSEFSLAGEGEAARVNAIIEFDLAWGAGAGAVVLGRSDNELGWAAVHFLTQLESLKDHPWSTHANRPEGRGHGGLVERRDPADEWAEALEFENREPEAIILGAGQSGLMLGARLERLGVDTLIIDRQARVGDVWRARYPSLALHNMVEINDYPFMPFPTSFPTYAPKERLADFMEYYAKAMELKVWGGSNIEKADYDESAKRWTVVVKRADGSTRELHPAHFVLATGLNGRPVMPHFPGEEKFTGTITHSEGFAGGRDWKGKKVVVVGAGVSAHDIAQDLWEQGAETTLLQRSASYIVDVRTFHKYFYGDYLVPGRSVSDADIMSSIVPLGILRKRGALKMLTDVMAAEDAELLDALRAKGFALDFRENGNGVAEGHYSGYNSYYFEIGASRLIAEGKIKVESGRGIDHFTENGIVLVDGTAIEADAVIMATGYTSVLDAARPIIGDEVADKVGEVWRWSDDNELTNVFRKTAQPGLWFMTGTIADARVGSQFLALGIKGIQAGLDSF